MGAEDSGRPARFEDCERVYQTGGGGDAQAGIALICALFRVGNSARATP